MIKYSYINSKAFQKWAIKTSKIDNYISEKLDKLGDYKLSEFAYFSALKLASVIRLADQVDEDESYKSEEVGYDLEQPDSNVAAPEMDGNAYLNMMVEALKSGGKNIYRSLLALSDLMRNNSISSENLGKLKSADFLKYLISLALDKYYNCNLFSGDDFINDDFQVLENHLETGQVGATSVSIINKYLKLHLESLSQDKLLLLKIKKVSGLLGYPYNEKYINLIFKSLIKEINKGEISEEDLIAYMQQLSYENIIASYELTSNANTSMDLRLYFDCYGLQAIKDYMKFLNIDKITQKELDNFELFQGFVRSKYKSIANNEFASRFIVEVQKALNYNYPRRLSGGGIFQIIDIVLSYNVEEFLEDYNAGKFTSDSSYRFQSIRHNVDKILQKGPDQLVQDYLHIMPPMYSKIYLEVGKEAIEESFGDAKEYFVSYKDFLSNELSLVDPKFIFEYTKKYSEAKIGGSTSSLFVKYYIKLKEQVINFSPAELNLLDAEKSALNPEMLLNIKAEYGDDYFGKDINIFRNYLSASSFLLTLRKSEVIKFVKEAYNKPDDEDIISTIGKFDFLRSAYQFYVFGGRNPDWETVADSLHKKDDNFRFKEILKSISEQNFYLGQLNWLSTKDFEKHGSFYGNYFSSKTPEKETLDKINLVKNAISRYPAYRMYEEGSPEYQKIFYMIFNNWELRGRNPDLLSGAIDKAVNSSCQMTMKNKVEFNYSSTGNLDYDAIFVNYFKTDDLSKLTPSDITSLKNKLSSFQSHISWIRTIKELKDKVIFQNVEVEDIRNPTVTPNDDIVRILYVLDGRFSGKFDENLLNDQNLEKLFTKIYIYCLSNDDCVNLSAQELVDQARMMSDNVLRNTVKNFPQYLINDKNSVIQTFNEEISNMSKIIGIFNNNADAMIARFAKRNLNMYQNFPKVLKVYNMVVHDLGNILPDINQNLFGFDKLFEKYNDNFDNEACIKLRFLGLSWSVEINDISNPNIRGTVKDLVKTNDIDEIINTLSIQTLRHIVGDTRISDEVMPHAREFSKHNVIDTREEVSHYDQVRKYETTKKVFLKGLKTKMPFYGSFDKSIETSKKDIVRLRFLPRADPRGMYLGIYSSCCQHPGGHAATCSFDGVINPKSAFLVCEINGKLAAQAYVYTGQDAIVLDSLETVGNTIYYSQKNTSALLSLLKDFASSLPNDFSLHIGETKLKLPNLEKVNTVKNPTKEFFEYITYFEKYTDAESNEMYTDASIQHLIPRN
jgi:hypothetical protein